MTHPGNKRSGGVAGLLLVLAPSMLVAQVPPAAEPPPMEQPSPAVELPGIPAGSAAAVPTASEAPAATVAAPAVADGSKVPASATAVSSRAFSYGDAPYSIMFTSSQIAAMKSALVAYESIRSPGGEESAVAVTGQPAMNAEPSVYPVFFLASIAYHKAGNWTVWVKQTPVSEVLATASPMMVGVPVVPPIAEVAGNGSTLRMTPKSNAGELKAIHVTADHVEFLWKPVYVAAITKRYVDKSFLSTAPIKNRLAKNNQVKFDEQLGAVRFTLKPGQSFSAAYFNNFEGNIDAVPMAPSATPGTFPIGIPGAMTPTAARDINSLLGTPAPGAPSPMVGAPVHAGAVGMQPVKP